MAMDWSEKASGGPGYGGARRHHGCESAQLRRQPVGRLAGPHTLSFEATGGEVVVRQGGIGTAEGVAGDPWRRHRGGGKRGHPRERLVLHEAADAAVELQAPAIGLAARGRTTDKTPEARSRRFRIGNGTEDRFPGNDALGVVKPARLPNGDPAHG